MSTYGGDTRSNSSISQSISEDSIFPLDTSAASHQPKDPRRDAKYNLISRLFFL